MKLILIWNRFINKIRRVYREKVFKTQIGCKHHKFCLVGDVTLINKNIILGENVTIYPGCMFYGDGQIIIGDNVDIGNNTIIYSSKNGGVTIGKNTMIGAQCYIIDANHGTAKGQLIRTQKNEVEPIFIGEDCWLAADVTVIKGSVIEDGAVVGAKALVNGHIESNSINVGVPAKKIKERILQERE